MTIKNHLCFSFFTRATEGIIKTKTTTLCCCFAFEKNENKEELKTTTTICVIVIVFYFSRMTNEIKKRHENDNCALSSLCLRGAKTRGKDDDNLCDC